MTWLATNDYTEVHSNGTKVCRVVVNGVDTFEVWPPGARLFVRRYKSEANAKRSVDAPRKVA
jgi:hypothetical protein